MTGLEMRRAGWLLALAVAGTTWGCTSEEDAKQAEENPQLADDGHNGNGSSEQNAGSPPAVDQTGDGSSDGDAEFPALTPTSSAGVDDLSAPPDDDASVVQVSPFVDASKDAFSTFGADVDTASYDYFRSTLTLYQSLPTPEYVRVEDFINFFSYDYGTPAHDASEPFAIDLVAEAHPLGRASSLVRVGIQAKAPPPQEKKPANVVFLVDVSGSMASDDKLPLAKLVLTEALDELDPTDTVSIVSYASDTRVRLGPTQVMARQTIENAIEGLESTGGTNGASGIQLAYAQASAGFIEGGINHVILCTDGDFNLGLTSNDELVELIRDKRETGITLTALGFGHDNLNDDMMERVSNAGNGMYAVVFSQDQAVEYAHEKLLSTLVHVAKDMKIQVEFNPEHVRAYRLLGYENRAIADDDFRNDVIDGGEVGAGHRVTALYEVVLAGQEVPAPEGAPALSDGEASTLTAEIGADEVVRVKVRYKQPSATDADPAAEVARAITPSDLTSDVVNDPDLAWAAAVAGFAERLRGSPYAPSAELAAIESIVAGQSERDGDRAEFAGLLAKAKQLLESPTP